MKINKKLSVAAMLSLLFAVNGYAENSQQAAVAFTCPDPNKLQVMGGAISQVERSAVWVLDNGLSGSIVPHSNAKLPDFLPVPQTYVSMIWNRPPTPTLEDFKGLLRQGGFGIMYASGDIKGNVLQITCQYISSGSGQEGSVIFKSDFPGEFYTRLKCNRGANMEIDCS